MKLNIGSGNVQIDGFQNVDRKFGDEAYPLTLKGEPVADDSVDEIRASHILEHFERREIHGVLCEWRRVLKPGGVLRVAVPDFDKCCDLRERGDPLWQAYILGGQTDANDFHKAIFTEKLLRAELEKAGFADVKEWISANTDCASHPCSLNLQGEKRGDAPRVEHNGDRINIAAFMSIPRLGFNTFWGCAYEALAPLGIPINRYTGAFWGQCLQRAFEDNISNLDWVLTLDYDTTFSARHLSILMQRFAENPEIDALAALQLRRRTQEILAHRRKGPREVETRSPTIPVDTAHFGFTLIRAECLRKLPKPWFLGIPDDKGGWGDGRIDPDVYFWHEWEKAGFSLHLSTDCRVGHIEEMISEIDENGEATYTHPTEWMKRERALANGSMAKVEANA